MNLIPDSAVSCSTESSNDRGRITPYSLCVHDLIAVQAATTPTSTALVEGNKSLTYGDLNERANQLAHFLRAKGVGPEVLVALRLRRSVDLVVAILGILKAGGAYIPLDPNYPSERQTLQLHDSGTKFLVTTDSLGMTLPLTGQEVVRLDADWYKIGQESRLNPERTAWLTNPAYVIYTSGSTGKPKGVVATHMGLVNYLSWAVKVYGKEARRSSLVHSSIAFDLTITGLYVPLLVGGHVELLPDEAGIESVVRALRQPKTRGLVKITPAHLDLLSQQLSVEEAAGKVELFVIGGENLPSTSLRFWRKASPTTRLINEYGPTETVVGCCVYEVQADDSLTGSVPIGKAIDNTYLYLLNESLEPVAPECPGELYVGGAGVARGYLKRPDLTLDHFLADPFSNELAARMYKTGDLARRRKDGEFEFLGRRDDQVKLRGYRIELGEVEAVITRHASVERCIAIIREDQPGNKQLVAYAIPRKERTVDPRELREFAQRTLPEYMVPTHFVSLDAFPLTSNGKVDRASLLTYETATLRRELTPPQTGVETKLSEIWIEVLGISPISVTDNFFELGGHSLLVAKLLVKIEQVFNKQLSMATLFEAPTIRSLSVILETQIHSTSQVIPVQPEGSLPPFFCIGAGPLFRGLALRLETDRPFLSIMASLLPVVTQLPVPYRIEQVAAYLADVILGYQKTGPYYLGGWSNSGIVAYETARQLKEKGHEVALLVMFDTVNPAYQQSVLKEKWLESWATKMKFRGAELVRLKFSSIPGYITEKVRELQNKFGRAAFRGQDKAGMHLRIDTTKSAEQIFHLAVSSYRPPPYCGHVVFFKAAEAPPGDAWDFSRGWLQLVKGEFEVYSVPGDHRSMFLEPNIKALANKMTECFQGSRASKWNELTMPVMAEEGKKDRVKRPANGFK